jgi:hypothetical protein
VQFGYGLNYLIDVENAVIVEVEAKPARTYDEVKCTEAMIARAMGVFGLKPDRLMADTAYGTGRFLRVVVDADIAPYIPVWDKSTSAPQSRCWGGEQQGRNLPSKNSPLELRHSRRRIFQQHRPSAARPSLQFRRAANDG